MTKIVKSECNKIRHVFELQDNEEVDLQTALRIFAHYSQGSNALEIWSVDTLIAELEGPRPALFTPTACINVRALLFVLTVYDFLCFLAEI